MMIWTESSIALEEAGVIVMELSRDQSPQTQSDTRRL